MAYLTETYGREKIAEILRGLRQSRTKDIDRVFREVLGVELEEFDKAWRQTYGNATGPSLKIGNCLISSRKI